MKNVIKTVGFIAFIAVIGFSMVGCGGGAGGDGGNPPPPTVTKVIVSVEDDATSVNKQAPGNTLQFSAEVKGTNSPPQTVTWSITTPGTKPGTTITQNGGLLTVANDEAVTSLTVKATSTFNTNQAGFATVLVKDTSKSDLTGTVIIKAGGIEVTTATTGTALTASYSGGSETVSYQWRRDGALINVDGWTNNSAATATFTPYEAGSYSVLVSAAGCNSIISDEVVVTGSTIPPENYTSVADRWWGTWVFPGSTATIEYSVDADDVCTVTIGGTAVSHDWDRWQARPNYGYTATANTAYEYEFEAWTQSGNRELSVSYYEDNDAGDYFGTSINITNERKTYTVTGRSIPKSGTPSLGFQGADLTGTFYVKVTKIESYTISDRWSKWDDISSAKASFSVAADGVCTVTVSGTAVTPDWNRWQTEVSYSYPSKANSLYEYEFEAWTQSGSRTLGVQYYNGAEVDDIYLSEDLNITTQRKTYTITGQLIPSDKENFVRFQCGDRLGTFYVKMLEIREIQLPENKPDAARWDSWTDVPTVTIAHSVAANDECTITVGGAAASEWDRWQAKAAYSYTAEADFAYEYEFEAWTQAGTRSLTILYCYLDEEGEFYDGISITNQRQTYTVTGKTLPKGGIKNVEFQCADQLGTFYVKFISVTKITPEQQTPEDRWDSGYDDSSSVTIDHSVANDGVCTITVGGTAVTEQPLWNHLWKAQASYKYTVQAGKRYEYEFEAWTVGADRKLFIQWYGDGDAQVFLGTGWDGTEEGNNLSPQFTITNQRKTYTIGGAEMDPLPKSGIQDLTFQCANQTGTFYVKILSITPVD